MAASGKVTQDQVQDFIFLRELAEVYLLLDHLSGRSDKSLAAAISKAGKVSIEQICQIAWPPKGTSVEQAAQAATLLMAKDFLNATAKPANGASIAFTLLVAGDDETTPVKRRWLQGFWRSAESSQMPAPIKGDGDGPPNTASGAGESDNSALPPVGAASNVAPTMPQGDGNNGADNSVAPINGIWGGQPPSRVSLAKRAYPGLIHRAARFNRQFKLMLLGLFLWLGITCLLSWNIAAGHLILARLDAVETERAAILKRIADAEVDEVKRPGATPALSPTAGTGPTPGPSALFTPLAVQRYCYRPQRNKLDDTTAQFEDVTQHQLCDAFTEHMSNYGNSREDLGDWLSYWGWVKWFPHHICGGSCLHNLNVTVTLPATLINPEIDEHRWAAVLVEVLTSSVLPLVYGVLGAGAAVVRNIWGKMKDSLLSPRDIILSWGQLALGAVIGASIGLFITPSGVGSQTSGLASAITLTPSALSFIAGFGVEGVFVTLESLIKRVFNIPEPKP